ncbi:MAG: hypothetical protein IJY39_09965 [Clostridia bacterium]|nr:hypothetical protein [Clostridia bacterium]
MFQLAQPIFPKGKEKEMNTFAVFRTEVDSLKGAKILLTAYTFYHLYVNGEFVAFGPARTAKGYARVDVIDLEKYHKDGKNVITVGVIGYNCRTLSTVYQSSFFIAEIVDENGVVAYSGRDFESFLPSCHVQKTERYSVQRHFTEVWDYTGKKSWVDEADRCESAVLNNLTYIDRVAPYAYYEDAFLDRASVTGTLAYDGSVTPRKRFYSFQPNAYWGTFEREEVGLYYEWVQYQKQTPVSRGVELPLKLGGLEYALFDFGRLETGFIGLTARATADTKINIAFSEYIEGEIFTYTDMHVQNVVTFSLGAGEDIDFMSLEPYTWRYAMVALEYGEIELEAFGVKRFENDVTGLEIPELENKTLRDIYRAAVKTYAHNAVDVYTDCPSRERAGWLCDSYFTGKTEHFLFGTTFVEDAFLENYRLYKNDDGLIPEGAIPMCFPSDVKDNGEMIPQWTMWYILEVADYLTNRNKSCDKELFRDSIYGLLDFYARYENADGLLEDLPSWNFVEWSKANQWVFNVNYPTNFLYAQVLEAAYELYGDGALKDKCAKVRRVAVEQSFDGKLFHDHSVRGENGELVLQNDISEICQYYAILFAGIDMNAPKYAELLRLVRDVFGAIRKEEMPEIEVINAFIGVYLRLEALLKLKEFDLVLADIESFFGNMERLTGTLWENRSVHGSLDHGFASYAAVAMMKALEEK